MLRGGDRVRLEEKNPGVGDLAPQGARRDENPENKLTVKRFSHPFPLALTKP